MCLLGFIMNSQKRKENFETTVSLRISSEVLRQVDSSARTEGRSRANYLRKIITDAMNMEA